MYLLDAHHLVVITGSHSTRGSRGTLLRVSTAVFVILLGISLGPNYDPGFGQVTVVVHVRYGGKPDTVPADPT